MRYVLVFICLLIPYTSGVGKTIKGKFEGSEISFRIADNWADSIYQRCLRYTDQDTAYYLTAQAIHESRWGKSKMSRKLNNWFGVKGKGGTYWTWEYIKGERVDIRQEFKYYPNLDSCLIGRLRIMRKRNDRGYATDPDYRIKLNKVMEQITFLYEVRRLNQLIYVEEVKRDSRGNYRRVEEQYAQYPR